MVADPIDLEAAFRDAVRIESCLRTDNDDSEPGAITGKITEIGK